jgi:hypothetical protein
MRPRQRRRRVKRIGRTIWQRARRGTCGGVTLDCEREGAAGDLQGDGDDPVRAASPRHPAPMRDLGAARSSGAGPSDGEGGTGTSGG